MGAANARARHTLTWRLKHEYIGWALAVSGEHRGYRRAWHRHRERLRRNSGRRGCRNRRGGFRYWCVDLSVPTEILNSMGRVKTQLLN